MMDLALISSLSFLNLIFELNLPAVWTIRAAGLAWMPALFFTFTFFAVITSPCSECPELCGVPVFFSFQGDFTGRSTSYAREIRQISLSGRVSHKVLGTGKAMVRRAHC